MQTLAYFPVYKRGIGQRGHRQQRHCARSPVDRMLASGAEGVGSTPAERTILQIIYDIEKSRYAEGKLGISVFRLQKFV